jgi:signal peptidase I
MPSIVMQLIIVLSWLAIPVGLVCFIDDWLLRPARRLKAGEAPAEHALVRVCYRALPIVVLAVVLRIFISETLNFSAVLVIITAATGLIWLLDALLLAPRRSRAAQAAGVEPAARIEPTTVDYARSFFPVAIVVLLVRSFLFEPFRIPSDSMMPTLLDGDFIVVEKFAYGLRLPITHTKILSTGEPRLGDVAVFRPPFKPSQDWIKRVVGLPGDHVVVRDDRITINGRKVPFKVTGTYSDGCYEHMQIATEHIGTHVHQALLCPVPLEVTQDPLPTCPRSDARGYYCGGNPPPDALPLTEPRLFDRTVPPKAYMMMGDNRDNSDDSRFWGFVPQKDLVGKATYIWFNWDIDRKGGPIWSRIGMKIK